MTRFYVPTLMGILLLSASLMAQEPLATYTTRETSTLTIFKDRPAFALENYRRALHSDNAGLIASALSHTLRLKVQYPQLHTEAFEKDLANLSANCNCPALRYRIELTALALKAPHLLPSDRAILSESPDSLFRGLSRIFSDSLLVASSKEE